MVSFIRKRLQVFVSSTYSDLIAERQSAVEAILTAGHIPAGMELFTSGDESQMEVIKQWIDESDVYLLILGGRYGSIEPRTGKSYTQLEYEYALSQAKPFFACVIVDAALDRRIKEQGKGVIETEEPQKLKVFRESVLTKTVRFWEDAKDIKIAISETLAHFMRRDDLAGWVRAGQEANMPALADEITRLSRENALLRSKQSKENAKELIQGLTFQELKTLLAKKGLLDYLRDHRTELASRNGTQDSMLGGDSFWELLAIGILEPSGLTSGFGDYYRLTSDGRKFLNQLEVEGLAQSSDAT